MVMFLRKKYLCEYSAFPVKRTCYCDTSWWIRIANTLSKECFLSAVSSCVSVFCCFSYENKYVKFFKSKPDLPPGMSAPDGAPSKQQQKVPGCSDGESSGLSKAAKRNMKRKEKRKQQQQQSQDGDGDGDGDVDVDVDPVSSAVENMSVSGSSESADKMVSVSSDPTAAAEKLKKIKNLKKKLRQVEELQQKVDSGEIKDLAKDQLEKLGRVKALQAELQQLE